MRSVINPTIEFVEIGVAALQTVLLQCWYPMTVCTLSRGYKETIARYLDETADSLESLPFKLHDFGYRGASSVEVHFVLANSS